MTQSTLLTISTMYVVFSVFHGRLRVCKFVRKVTKFLLRDSIIEPGEAQKNQHVESRVYIVDKKKWFVSEYQYVRASDMKGNTKWQYLEDNWITLMLATPHQIVPTLKVARRKDLKGSNSTSGDGKSPVKALSNWKQLHPFYFQFQCSIVFSIPRFQIYNHKK